MKHGQLNSNYAYLSAFVDSLPNVFETTGMTIYAERNTLKQFDVDGLSLIVKRYRIPLFINRIVYAFFRKSKARRAYENALKVVELGFETPLAIAYLEERKGGILGYSYFVSTLAKGTDTVRKINFETANYTKLLNAMGKYVGQLQNAGICHEDLSPGNILYRIDPDGAYAFELCDINRMNFRQLSRTDGITNLKRLLYKREAIDAFAGNYAEERGGDQGEMAEAIDQMRKIFWRKKGKKWVARLG